MSSILKKHIEHFELDETENLILREVLKMKRDIDSNGGHGKIFVEVEKFKVIVKQTIHKQKQI